MKNRYFLQHFKHSRPYYDRAFSAAVIAAAARGPEASSRAVFDAIVRVTAAKGLRTERLLEHNFLANETFSAQAMVQLEADGYPLYDIEPALLEALANSDVGDMRLADLRAPNRAYYLHWGPQPHLQLHGRYPVEGAFVFCHGQDWRVGLCARNPSGWLLPVHREVFQLRFPADCLSLPFDQAVDVALERDMQDISQAAAQLQGNPGRQALVQEIRSDLEGNIPVLKEALRLAGNCFAYLTAYPDDSRFDWESDTPPRMLVKLERGDKERQRTASKLNSMGYLQVHRVGLDFLQSAERAQSEAAEGGHSVRPHWRRGHWRHQAYGEQHALRKLIWLRPTRVLGGPARD